MGNRIEDFPLILLAGGRSSRMGTPKGLLNYHGHPWLIEQLRRFKAASGKRVIIVLGFHQAPYFEQIPWMVKAVTEPVQELGLEISATTNPAPEHGQFSSLQCAIDLLNAHHPSTLLNPLHRGRGRKISFRPVEGPAGRQGSRSGGLYPTH